MILMTVLLFSDGKNQQLVVWTTSPQEHKIRIPSDDYDFEIIGHKGIPIKKKSAKSGSLVIKLNDFVKFIKVKGPNHAIENEPDVDFTGAIVMPIHGKLLAVRVYNFQGEAMNRTVRLTEVKGFESVSSEMKYQLTNEIEKITTFSLKSKPGNEIYVGLQIEENGKTKRIPPFKYQFSSNNMITSLDVKLEARRVDKSEQTVSVHSAPEPLFDSDLPVIKMDYQFSGHNWKYY